MFNCDIDTIIDMIYYTSRFGELNPSNFMTKIFVMLKGIGIFILVTGNLAIYISIDSKEIEEELAEN